MTCNPKTSPKAELIRPRNAGERGSLVIMVAMSMVVLLGFMGLAFDCSYFYLVKRRMQTAADAGASAGAQELLRANSAAVTTAARNDTALNHFSNGVNGINVTVNNPPASGPRAGNNGFVEVMIDQRKPTWFLGALGLGPATIRARAVAGLSDTNGCVYALNRDTSNTNNGFFANGTTNSTFSCGVFSNGNFRTVGGGCVVAPSLSYTGDYSNASSGSSDCAPRTTSRGVPAADPLLGRYTLPSTSPCNFTNYKKTSGGALTLVPGVYCGGIDIGGSIPNATFTPGTYVLVGGGMKIGSGVSATGTAVTFFNSFPGSQTNKYGQIIINTSGNVTFTAPTSGVNKALLFWQDPRVTGASNNGSTITAGANSAFQGILYFPTTDLTFAGNSYTTADTSSGYTYLVGYNIKVAGKSKINSDYSSIGGNPLQMAAFVE